MQPLVSIIIPVYNVAPYLREALDSVVHQTYKNLDIIIVNDGSTDNSLEIAQEYTVDKRVKLFSQKNQGASGARNLAFEKATGAFFYCFDPDDILELNAINECMDIIQRDKLDILGFSATSFGDFKFKEDRYLRNNSAISSGKEFLEEHIASSAYRVLIWLYIARKSIIDENNIRFIDRIPHQDETFTFDVWYHAERVKVIDRVLYRHRYRPGSTMTRKKKEINAIALLKVRQHFIERYADFSAGQYQINKFYYRIIRLIMKKGIPFSVMDGFDFKIPVKYRIKYLPHRFWAYLRNVF